MISQVAVKSIHVLCFLQAPLLTVTSSSAINPSLLLFLWPVNITCEENQRSRSFILIGLVVLVNTQWKLKSLKLYPHHVVHVDGYLCIDPFWILCPSASPNQCLGGFLLKKTNIYSHIASVVDILQLTVSTSRSMVDTEGPNM